MSRHVAIEPFANGFVIRQVGTEQVWASSQRAVLFIPSDWPFHFDSIDAARDFCAACDFTWSVRVGQR